MHACEIDQVIEAAARVAGGDVDKARRWFMSEPLREFGGSTAAKLVRDGRAADVLRLLEMIDAGFLG